MRVFFRPCDNTQVWLRRSQCQSRFLCFWAQHKMWCSTQINVQRHEIYVELRGDRLCASIDGFDSCSNRLDCWPGVLRLLQFMQCSAWQLLRLDKLHDFWKLLDRFEFWCLSFSQVLCVLGFCKSAMDWDLGVGAGLKECGICCIFSNSIKKIGAFNLVDCQLSNRKAKLLQVSSLSDILWTTWFIWRTCIAKESTLVTRHATCLQKAITRQVAGKYKVQSSWRMAKCWNMLP